MEEGVVRMEFGGAFSYIRHNDRPEYKDVPVMGGNIIRILNIDQRMAKMWLVGSDGYKQEQPDGSSLTRTGPNYENVPAVDGVYDIYWAKSYELKIGNVPVLKLRTQKQQAIRIAPDKEVKEAKRAVGDAKLALQEAEAAEAAADGAAKAKRNVAEKAKKAAEKAVKKAAKDATKGADAAAATAAKEEATEAAEEAETALTKAKDAREKAATALTKAEKVLKKLQTPPYVGPDVARPAAAGQGTGDEASTPPDDTSEAEDEHQGGQVIDDEEEKEEQQQGGAVVEQAEGVEQITEGLNAVTTRSND